MLSSLSTVSDGYGCVFTPGLETPALAILEHLETVVRWEGKDGSASEDLRPPILPN
jgi:hypothetical protein